MKLFAVFAFVSVNKANVVNECASGPQNMRPTADCTGFFSCVHGQKTQVIYCPEGLLYNGQGYCDYAKNVDCYKVRSKVQRQANVHENLSFSLDLKLFSIISLSLYVIISKIISISREK